MSMWGIAAVCFRHKASDTKRERRCTQKMRRSRRLLVGGITALMVAGCGEEKPSLMGDRARGLPLVEYELGNLCPEKSDIYGADARRTRVDAQRKLAALLDAYRRDPDATVRAEYTAAEDADRHYETVSLRDLIEGNLRALRQSHCAPEAQERLVAVLDRG